MTGKGLRPLALAAGLACVPATAWAQCAMCRLALQSPEGRQLAAAFRGGILFLLAAPFATFAIIALLVVRMHRRRRSAASSFQL